MCCFDLGLFCSTPMLLPLQPGHQKPSSKKTPFLLLFCVSNRGERKVAFKLWNLAFQASIRECRKMHTSTHTHVERGGGLKKFPWAHDFPGILQMDRVGTGGPNPIENLYDKRYFSLPTKFLGNQFCSPNFLVSASIYFFID